jgi:hypothetical protein
MIGKVLNRLKFWMLMALLASSCAPKYAIDVFVEVDSQSFDSYYAEGNFYWFVIYDGSGNEVFRVDYDGQGDDSFRTDDLPFGTDLTPAIEVLDASSNLILEGELTSTDYPGTAGSDSITIEDGITTSVTILVSSP